MKKIVLAIVVNDLAMAGVQRLAVDQVQLLPPDTFDLHLIVLRKQKSVGDFFHLVPTHVKVYRLDFTSLYDVYSWVRLLRVLRVISPDIVKSSLFFSNTVMRLCQPWYRYVLITAEHNTDLVKKRLQYFFNRMLYRLDFVMVVDSQMVATFLSTTEKIPRTHFKVIYNGVDIERIQASKETLLAQRSSIRSKLRVGKENFLFITVARLVKQKNHQLMIDAFAELYQVRKQARLVIVGDGPLRPDLERQIDQLGLRNLVQLVGEHADTHPFYIASDCFLMTSKHEGFCIAAMDGLAFEKPLISTRVAGIEEYLIDGVNGYFVPGDKSSVAETMKLVIDLPEDKMKRLKANAQSTSVRYSKERFKDEYVALLQQAYLSSRRR
jgi:glycosyltransferase involved in cell wall biosynthesis